MNPDAFKNSAAGRVILQPKGYHAFIPAVLPPVLNFDHDLVLMLSRADAALSELSGLGRVLPNPEGSVERSRHRTLDEQARHE